MQVPLAEQQPLGATKGHEPSARSEARKRPSTVSPNTVSRWNPPSGADGCDDGSLSFRVYARVELPGPPWECAILIEGAITVTLVGLPDDQAVWVAVGAVLGGQEGPTRSPVVVTPRRDGGARVLVPAGAVLLGRDGGLSHEGPAHHVYLDALWIDRCPATNAELRACVDAGACPRPARPESFISGTVMVADYFDDPIYDGFPAVALDWRTAADLCDWRSGRLPTEAEWETAAGPGPHPWGDAPPACALANFDDDGHLCVGGTAPWAPGPAARARQGRGTWSETYGSGPRTGGLRTPIGTSLATTRAGRRRARSASYGAVPLWPGSAGSEVSRPLGARAHVLGGPVRGHARMRGAVRICGGRAGLRPAGRRLPP